MPITRRVHNGTQLTTSAATVLTFGTGLIPGGAVVQSISVTTVGGTARVVSIYLIPIGQTASDQYLIYRGNSVPNETYPIPGGPWFAGSGAFIQAKQAVGTDVVVRVESSFEEVSA
jgi:hypothetical protein